jgi:adenine-specific DNA-methyltransferase
MPDGMIVPQDMSEGKIKTELLTPLKIENGVNAEEFELKGEWRYSQSKLDEIVAAGEEIVISKIPFRPNHIKKGGEIKKMHNLLSIAHYKIATNEDADSEQVELMGASFFDYSKPVGLINLLIKSLLYDNENALVLDFFAGSGTTGHSVLNYNLDSESDHKFIMVQLPELCDESTEAFKAGYKTIAEISKERIRRSAAKIKEENPEYDGDLGFKVFKLDSTNIKPWEVDFDLTERTLEDFISNIKTNRREEDVLYEILLKYGLDLTLPITEHAIAGQKVFDIGMGALIICLSDAISLEVVEGIAKLKDELNPEIMRVVFKDSGFKDDVVKTNAVQILKQAGIVDVRSL